MQLAFSDDAGLEKHLGRHKRWLPTVMMCRLAARSRLLVGAVGCLLHLVVDVQGDVAPIVFDVPKMMCSAVVVKEYPCP